MNKNNAKDFLPLVLALVDGREIERRGAGDVKWEPATYLDTDINPTFYRIKKTPKVFYIVTCTTDGQVWRTYNSEESAKETVARLNATPTHKAFTYIKVVEEM